MTKAELRELEDRVARLVALRRRLGFFDANAEAFLALSEATLMIIGHLKEKTPAKKGK